MPIEKMFTQSLMQVMEFQMLESSSLKSINNELLNSEKKPLISYDLSCEGFPSKKYLP